MRRLIVHEFITLDGVIQAPGHKDEDREGGFTNGGWTMPYWHDDIGARFFETMKDSDTILLGRKTWQIHSVFEKMESEPFADALNAMQKVVVSNTLTSTDAWRNSTLISGDVAQEVQKLKKKPGKNILIDGSSVLLHSLIEHDLIDEIQLHVYPLVLGKGKRLFPEEKKLSLKLLEAKVLPTGVVFQKYKVINYYGK